MKKIAIVIVILIIAIVLFAIGRHIPFGAGNSVFHVEHTDRIYRILISGEDNTVKLSRRSQGWYVNDINIARQGAVEFLLETIGDISIKSPVSDEVYSDLVESELTEHLEVKIYDKRKLMQSFHVFRSANRDKPGIMQKRKNTKPFIMHMPGYDTDPTLYFFDDARFWLPFTVFRYRPSQISEIQMNYYNDPDSSFTINRTENGIGFSSEENENGAIDTMAVERYLSYFTFIPFENWAYNISKAASDSITAGNPYFKLTVFTLDNDTINLFTWKRKIKKGNMLQVDTDRMWGTTNRAEDLFIIKYYDVDPLIKGPSYFISE
ncbi:MAG TPA: hypothetical protein DEQ09_04675 [Bacteroidales bacterium]|nr:hypothetical protein [Bacteroidales bacterium]